MHHRQRKRHLLAEGKYAGLIPDAGYTRADRKRGKSSARLAIAIKALSDNGKPRLVLWGKQQSAHEGGVRQQLIDPLLELLHHRCGLRQSTALGPEYLKVCLITKGALRGAAASVPACCIVIYWARHHLLRIVELVHRGMGKVAFNTIAPIREAGAETAVVRLSERLGVGLDVWSARWICLMLVDPDIKFWL